MKASRLLQDELREDQREKVLLAFRVQEQTAACKVMYPDNSLISAALELATEKAVKLDMKFRERWGVPAQMEVEAQSVRH